MKSSRTPPHNQARVDQFCKTIREFCEPEPLSEAELLLFKFGGLKGVFHQHVYHDRWCRTMRTGNGNDCNCSPITEVYRQKTDI